MPLIQVSIPVSGALVEALEELLYELGKSSWNIYLDQDTQLGVASGVYEIEEEARADWIRINPFFEELLGSLTPRFKVLPDTEWKDSYKAHFKPWNFGGLHWVPIWEKKTYCAPENEAVVWLDPGMAFGTGNHETTRLCIEAFLSFLQDGKRHSLPIESISCCDAGCGSGILAISAKKVGIPTVVGFDNDPDAVRISKENAVLNNLEGEIDFKLGDLDSGFKNQSYDLVFANILGAVLIKQPYALLSAVKPGGRLILSGMLGNEVREVRQTYEEKMKRVGKNAKITSHTLGEWADLVVDFV